MNYQLKHYDTDPTNSMLGAEIEVAVGINGGKQLLQALDIPRLLLSNALRQSMAKNRNESNNNTNRSFMRRSMHLDDFGKDNSGTDTEKMEVEDLLSSALPMPNEEDDELLSSLRMRFGLPRSRHSSLGSVPASAKEKESFSYGESLKSSPFPVPQSWSTSPSRASSTQRRRWDPPIASNLKPSISDRSKTLREFAEWRERLRIKTANRGDGGFSISDNNNNDNNSFIPRSMPRPILNSSQASDKKPTSPRNISESPNELKRPTSSSLDNFPSSKMESTTTLNASESILASLLQPTNSTTDASTPTAPTPDNETTASGSKKTVLVNSSNIMDLLKKFDGSSK